MSASRASIQLALISHTNAGKTTLARTLVGMDVGEVRDAPHVTTMSEGFTLLATPEGDELRLWDTPGFGDSARLLKRLAMSGNPIGWFLRDVVDRYRDRPFWLSQQAVRTARDAADVVLYLVNSAEEPRDMGYLAPEMKILQWLGKPVVVLLNQMGPPRPAGLEQAELARWKGHLAMYPVVRETIALDAFARCWVHERVFYDTVRAWVPDAKKDAFQRLLAVWENDNRTRFQAAMALVARQITLAAQDREPIATETGAVAGMVLKAIGLGQQRERKRQERAMAALLQRLDANVSSTTAGLLKLYRIDPGAAATINERVNSAFVVRAPVDTRQAGLLGAVLSGAAAGLSADLMAGGLTAGAGALLGGIVGALGFAGAAWGFNASTDRRSPHVQFSDDFLRSMVVAGLLRYLAVAHFGRGRGNFTEGEHPAFWQREAELALAREEQALAGTWHTARTSALEPVVGVLSPLLARMASTILDRLYPRASAAGD